MEQLLLTRQQMLSELFRSPHGNLAAYIPFVTQAGITDPVFLAHALAHDKRHGSIRDVQVGIPTLTLALSGYPAELRENSLGLLGMLPPPDLFRAWPFGVTIPLPASGVKRLKYLTHAYLRAREQCWPWWERTVLHFKRQMKALYALSHTKPSAEAQAWLFDGRAPSGSLFARLQQCAAWSADEVSGFLREQHIPFLVAQGTLKARCQEPAILAALIDGMTPAQLLRNRKSLQAWGADLTGATRGALHGATARAKKGGKRDTLLLASQAQAVIEDDPTLTAELDAIQEAQLDQAPGIDGDWLVLADKSDSMQHAIEQGRVLAAFLARQVRGKVWLIFFDHEPYVEEVTGKTYAEIQQMTHAVVPSGGTSIGCGLAVILERGIRIDAIAIVSDGGERHPPTFEQVYAHYTAASNTQVPVYLYRIQGSDPDWLSPQCQKAGIPYQVFPIAADMDQYGLQALAQTMRVQRYALLDEIMHTPLVTMEQALRVPKHWREYEYAVHL